MAEPASIMVKPAGFSEKSQPGIATIIAGVIAWVSLTRCLLGVAGYTRFTAQSDTKTRLLTVIFGRSEFAGSN